MKNSIFIFLLIYVGMWSSTLLMYLDSYFKILYFLSYESLLVYFIYFSLKNKLAFLLALSSFIYFYQVPLMDFFPHDKLGVYNFKLNIDIQFEAYSIYNIVLGCIFPLIYYIKHNINFEDLVLSVKHKRLLNQLFYVSIIFSIGLLLFSILNSGGLNSYLMLNKFEASQSQKILFFTYKDFATITLVTGLLSNNKRIIFFTYILMVFFVGFEILSAKRIIILFVASYFFMFNVKRIKGRYFLYIYISIFLMTLIKFIYYNIRLYILAQSTFSDIFWFDWADVFYDTIFIHEGRGHIELLLSYLYNHLELSYSYFLDQLLVSLPFGHNIVSDYKTAGEFLRLYLHEPWTGLASSQYIVPYLSIGFVGIILVYIIQFLIIFILNYFIKLKNNMYLNLLLFINVPIILFYSHREEIIVITKNLFVSSVALFVVYGCAIILMFMKNIIVNRTHNAI